MTHTSSPRSRPNFYVYRTRHEYPSLTPVPRTTRVHRRRAKLKYFRRGPRRVSSNRCRLLLESVTDLKTRLRAKGSDLVVQRGCPEDVIPDLASKLLGDGASVITLFAHTSVCSEEADVHGASKAALPKPTGGGDGGGGGTAMVTEIWRNTLHRPSDLPFDFPSGVPAVFTDVRSRTI